MTKPTTSRWPLLPLALGAGLAACSSTMTAPPGDGAGAGTATGGSSSGASSGASGASGQGTGGGAGTTAGSAGTGAGIGVAPGGRGGTNVIPSTELDSGRVVLRRLNRAEYDNTVRDLLGTMSRLARDTFAAEDVEDGFDNNGNRLVMSLLLADQVEKAAGTLVDELLARPTGDAFRTRIVSCAPTTANAATCLPQILSAFMKNAYRRPVTAEEVAGRVALATSVQQATSDVTRGLKAALKSVLLSPHFLYRVELGDPASPAATPVSDYELASRLSYFLWGTMPDAALFAAADAAKLSPAGPDLTSEVDRLLADPKVQGFIESFAGQWLSARDAGVFVPDPDIYPAFDDALRLAAPQEAYTFFAALVAEKQPLTSLLLADFTFVNDRLATHYGLPGGQTGFARVSLQGSPRAGILSQNAFLTVSAYPTRTSPVRRADWIAEHLLCDPPQPPPPDVPAFPDPPQDQSGMTLRQKFEAHRANPECAGCHEVLDPMGFALENFDAIGAYRTMDNGGPIDATGELEDGTPLTGSKDLAEAVANDADFSICVTKQLLTYAVGRSFSAPEAKAYAAGLGLPLRAGTWSDLLHAVTTSQAFLTRRGEAP